MLNDEEDVAYRSEKNESCAGSRFWSFALDPFTGGACYGGSGASISCATGGSSATTTLVGSSLCLGIPAALSIMLMCYKASADDRTQVKPPFGTTCCVNVIPSMFHCGSEKNTEPPPRLTTSSSSRQLSSTSSLLAATIPGQTHSPYGSGSTPGLNSRSSLLASPRT